MTARHEVISLLDSDDDSYDDFPNNNNKRVPKHRELDNGTLEILESDEEEEELDTKLPAKTNTSKENRSPNSDRLGVHKKQKVTTTELEVVEAAPPTALTMVPAAASLPTNNNNDIELVGTIGTNALIDFPHARAHCVQFPFAQTASHNLHCPNCFCYVCDTNVSQCKHWNDFHCHAIHSDPKWQRERKRYKQNAGAPKVARRPDPIPTQQPQHRHPALLPPIRRPRPSDLPSVKSLLNAVTRVYPSERSPPPPFCTNLRHYQKQALAFCIDVETGQMNTTWTMNDCPTRGGWLCSEVGMGKTACIVALVCSNPLTRTKGQRVGGRKLYRTTVVMTSVSLMGQWEDECKKHAPHLNVLRFHPPSQTSVKRRPTWDMIKQADIVITSATFDWENYFPKMSKALFHRTVMDESHLFYGRAASACPKKAAKIPASNRWCVTATPMSSTPFELNVQLAFLGIVRVQSQTNVYSNPETLKNYMIRHVKSQRINGSVALALPKSTTTVKYVALTPNGQRAYEANLAASRYQIDRLLLAQEELKWTTARTNILYNMMGQNAKANDTSKVTALEKALVDLTRKNPNTRAVVFTQFRPVQSLVNDMVKRLGIKLYWFDGSTPTKKRDEAIRSFQSMTGRAVFSITTNTGSVGITLTAASHVFMMEPCINPSDETQAAGRIHRLGQTKNVSVTKFVHPNTVETNIVQLHKEIEAGRVQFSQNGLSPAAVQVLLRDL